MSDSGFDLLIYIALTVGASALGLLKSSKEKKEKSAYPETPLPEYDYEDELEDEPVIISQQLETKKPEIIITSTLDHDRLTKKMNPKREESLTGFGRTDEERYVILEKRQQEGRNIRKNRLANLFKDEEEISNDPRNKELTSNFEFDIRQAVIANEILNRKY